jgi:hypothetical protein
VGEAFLTISLQAQENSAMVFVSASIFPGFVPTRATRDLMRWDRTAAGWY